MRKKQREEISKDSSENSPEQQEMMKRYNEDSPAKTLRLSQRDPSPARKPSLRKNVGIRVSGIR